MLSASDIAIVTLADFQKLKEGIVIDLPKNCTRLMFREMDLCFHLRETEELINNDQIQLF